MPETTTSLTAAGVADRGHRLSDAQLEREWSASETGRILDDALAVAPALPVERKLVWSKRLRDAGRPEDCPLVAAALDPQRQPVERAIAAGSAWMLARDERAASVLSSLAPTLGVFDRLAVAQLAPELIEPLPSYYLHARPEVLALIPGGAVDILELGCAAGALGSSIKARQPCRYVGVELDPAAARIAANSLDQIEVLDLDQVALPFEPASFDCVVCADVLEHIKDPWAALAALRRLLKPGGTLVVSIPNIRNLGILAQVAAGDWQYQDAGILDRTHLRFFTLRSFSRALVEAGFDVGVQQAVVDPALQACVTEQHGAHSAVLAPLQITGLSPQDAMELTTIQFLIVASAPPASLPLAPPASPARPRPAAAVVVLAWNAWEQTERCLAHLEPTLGPDDQVVVVDNGSVDGTAEGLRRFPWAHVIRNAANRGFPAGCNQGAALDLSPLPELVVFLNNDTVPVGGWLDALLLPFAHDEQVGATGARSNFVSGPQLVHSVGYTVPGGPEHVQFVRRWEHDHAGQASPMHRLVGFCLAVRRSALDRVGGFDEAFGLGGYDDDDLCRRLLADGWKLLVSDGAYVHHDGHKTFDANHVDWAELEESNRQVFERKHSLDGR